MLGILTIGFAGRVTPGSCRDDEEAVSSGKLKLLIIKKCERRKNPGRYFSLIHTYLLNLLIFTVSTAIANSICGRRAS